MPDALTSAAEEMAPSRPTTNYFNPAAGQSIISRYANAKRGAVDSGFAADAADKLRESNRRASLWDQEQADYHDKQDFKAQRGEFLTKLAELHHDDPDYESKRDEILAASPELAAKDDAVRDMLTFKDRSFDARRQTKDRQDYQKNMLDARSTRYEQSALTKAAEAGLTPDEIENFRTPEGDLDIIGIAHASGQRSRTEKKEDTKEMIIERARVAKENRDTTDATDRRNYEAFSQSVKGDTLAFPSQMSALVHQFGKEPSEIATDHPDLYEAAVTYDKNKPNAEIESARNMRRTEFVNKGWVKDEKTGKILSGADLPTALQVKRENLWDFANKQGEYAPKGETSAAPGAGAAKTLDADTGMQFLKDAGGDREKARQMARDAGYTF